MRIMEFTVLHDNLSLAVGTVIHTNQISVQRKRKKIVHQIYLDHYVVK